MPDTKPVVRTTVLPGPSHPPVAIETSAAPPAKEKVPPASGLSRAQILEATEACFAEVGYEGTTIRAIAGRLGRSVGSIYRYFQDKRQLLLACGERVLAPAAEVLEAGEAVEDSAMTYAERAAAHGSLYRLMFWLGATDERALPPIVERILAGWADRLGERALAERRWAALHGALMLGQTADEAALAASGASTATDRSGRSSREATRESARSTERSQPHRPDPPQHAAPPHPVKQEEAGLPADNEQEELEEEAQEEAPTPPASAEREDMTLL